MKCVNCNWCLLCTDREFSVWVCVLCRFVLAAFVGSRQFPGVECSNKKDGKKEAADVAMRILLAEGHQTQAKSVSCV